MWNLGINCSLSLLEVTRLCKDITGNRIDINRIEKEREMNVRIYISDNTKVQQDIEWLVRKSPHDILSDIYVWIHEHESIIKKTIL